MVFSAPSHGFDASDTPWSTGQTTFSTNSTLGTLFQSSFEDALSSWNNNSTFKFNTNSSSAFDPCSGGSTSPNGAKFSSNNCGSGFGGNTVAIQTAFFSNGVRTRTIIVFNSAKNWVVEDNPSGNEVDFYRVAVHELGHSLGLDHEESAPGGAIMQAITSSLQDPQADDIAGVAFMYDTDGDGIGIADDNCPDQFNDAQLNQDSDAFGDVCDSDIDNDGVFDSETQDQSVGIGNLSSSFFSAGNSNSAFAQTFTVGISGDLKSVELPIYCPSGNLQITIRTLNGSNPSSTVLDSSTFSNGFTRINTGFISIPVSGIPVSSGDKLAVTLDSSGVCRWTTTPSSYSGGSGRFSNNRTSWFALTSGTVDLPFATMVLPSQLDNCPTNPNSSQQDSDNDGKGNACDNCPVTSNPDQIDSNGDGEGDACEDDDGDNVFNADDNCPNTPNTDQLNFDGDSEGDECDNDIDNDGVLNGADDDFMNRLVCSDNDMDMCDDCSRGFFNVDNDGTDSDGDGQCNVSDPDNDDDGLLDGDDNCPNNANPGQSDFDMNGVGDACEPGFCVPVRTISGGIALVCV